MQTKIAWYLLTLLFKELRKRSKDKSKLKAVLPKKKNSTAKVIGWSVSALGLAGLALFLYGTKIEPRRYRLERLTVYTGSDEGSSDPIQTSLKILHISDLHIGAHDLEKVRFIQKITDDDYDLVILTGDVFEFNDGIKYGDSLLTRKPKLGAYAVMGNHDYYDYTILNKTLGRVIKKLRHPPAKKDVTPHCQALAAAGFKVLFNESDYIESAGVFVVGIDYPGIKNEELQDLVKKAPPHALKLALFHLPRRLDAIVDAGFDLAFGGHTHGGQIRLPGYGALITDSELPRGEASGLIKKGGTAFHISRGLGADPRSNIRLFCPPAATVIDVLHAPGLDFSPGTDAHQRKWAAAKPV